jgi:hypothetical protein
MRPLIVCLAVIAAVVESAYSGQLSSSSIDAVTAATVNNSCKFNYPIQATDTSAVITWAEEKNGGTCSFCYGKVSPPSTCRAVLATERTTSTINLTGLSPSTTYFIYIEMTKPGESPYAASGSFTTTTKAAIAVPVVQASGRPSIFTGNHISLGTDVFPGDRIVQTDLAGREIYSRVVRGNEPAMSLANPGHRVTVVSIKRGNTVVRSFKLLSMIKGF